MHLCSVEHKLNTSLTFFSSKLDSPVIKTLERIRFSNQNIGDNLVLMKKMSKKCSTCVQLNRVAYLLELLVTKLVL